jgi:putative glutamine amidotransferase
MTYVEAVRAAGAVPVVLPPLDDEEALAAYVQRLDGLVLVGGRDIPAGAYGEEDTSDGAEMPSRRWEFESELLRGWLATDKPVLGICLGSQFANVVQGGTLIQDIPSEVGREVVHETAAGRPGEHAVRRPGRTRSRRLGPAPSGGGSTRRGPPCRRA